MYVGVPACEHAPGSTVPPEVRGSRGPGTGGLEASAGAAVSVNH